MSATVARDGLHPGDVGSGRERRTPPAQHHRAQAGVARELGERVVVRGDQRRVERDRGGRRDFHRYFKGAETIVVL